MVSRRTGTSGVHWLPPSDEPLEDEEPVAEELPLDEDEPLDEDALGGLAPGALKSR